MGAQRQGLDPAEGTKLLKGLSMKSVADLPVQLGGPGSEETQAECLGLEQLRGWDLPGLSITGKESYRWSEPYMASIAPSAENSLLFQISPSTPSHPERWTWNRGREPSQCLRRVWPSFLSVSNLNPRPDPAPHPASVIHEGNISWVFALKPMMSFQSSRCLRSKEIPTLPRPPERKTGEETVFRPSCPLFPVVRSEAGIEGSSLPVSPACPERGQPLVCALSARTVLSL